MNRIDAVFQKPRPALAVYTVVGYPDSVTSGKILEALSESAADIIELGMPFSDPVADGPVIQKAHAAALERGSSLDELFDAARTVGKASEKAVVAMGYLNPVLSYGFERFLRCAVESGVDGIILPDLPPEEYDRRYRQKFEQTGIYPVFLVSPNTSDSRIKYIDSLSKGFLYAVSSLTITGSANNNDRERDAYLSRLSKLKLSNPVMVGFGIKTRSDFAAVTSHVRGAIVGSAFIEMLSSGATDSESVKKFAGDLR